MKPYVPAWPVLDPADLVRRPVPREGLPFPLWTGSAAGFHAARYAIFHLVRTLGLRESETVLVPAYHHGNEVRALRAAGARVRFYGIDRALAPDLEGIEGLAREGARVLYVIHFLGWPQPLDEMLDLCRRRGLLLVEDCALALLSESAGRPLGSRGDYSVFCLYKTLAVPNGGVLVGAAGDGARRPGPGTLTVAGRAAEMLLQGFVSRIGSVGRPLLASKRAAGRALSAVGAARVPVGDDRFEPSAAGLGLAGLTRWLLPRFDFAGIRARRRANWTRLRERLAGRVDTLRLELTEGVCPLFFPVIVEDKAAVARALWRRGIETVQVWNEGDPEARGFEDVDWLRRHVLELPVHDHMTREQVEYVAEETLKVAAAPRRGGGRRAA